MSQTASDRRESRPREYCTLEYRPRDVEAGAAYRGPVVAVLRRSPLSGMSILVDPNWRAFVHPSEAGEVSALINDFAVRAATDPASLWTQLEGVNFSLLVVGEYGEDSSEQVSILRILNRFVCFVPH